MKNKFKCIGLTLCAIGILVFVSFSLKVLNVQAYTGLSETDEKSLYNETNTYDIDNDCFDGNNFIATYEPGILSNSKFRYKLKYNLGQKNSNTVMDYPQITVLTPGLGSDAGVWSNTYSTTKSDMFAYNKDSIITKIAEFTDGANIYWVKMKSATISVNIMTPDGVISVKKNEYNLNLHDVTNQKSIYVENKINNITDISKHIIVVFDPADAGGLNDNLYYQLNYALSKIIYDVKILNGGILPKINLIGHSRGGLTNLQYTLDHPDLVDSLISIDTPYFSSTTANLFGEIFMGGKNDGLSDILKPDVYYDYNKRWNDDYDTLYNGIKVSAYGTYHTLVSLSEVVFNDNSGQISELGATGISAALAALNVAKLVTATKYLGEQLAVGLISECLDFFLPASKVVDAAEILFKELNFDIYPAFVSWYNDILVDLDSQLGLDSGSLIEGTGSYKGFNRIIRPFIGGGADRVDYTRVAEDNVPVGHNLVTRDEIIINSIVCQLKLGATTDFGFWTSEKSDGSLKIDGYKGGYPTSNFEVPEQIDGKNVTEISPFAFLSLDKSNITSITIPDTIKEIGTYAFSGFTEVTDITISTASVLEEISEGSFCNCKKLIKITLPNSLQKITPTAFMGCDALTSIDVAEGNAVFSGNEGILYNKNGTALIYCPLGKNIDSGINLDNEVTEIGVMAFYGHKNLSSINLNNVTLIREEAFFGCINLTSIVGTQVRIIERAALFETKWLNDQIKANIDYISIGTALYSYMGNATDVDLSAYTNVSEGAFMANHTIENITFGNNMLNIGSLAFYDCENLQNVYLNNNNNVIYVGTGSFDKNSANRNLHIPKTLQSQYEENELWQQYELTVHQTNIVFDTNGGDCNTATGSVYYQDYLSLPIPTKDGYIFDGWYDNSAFLGEKLDQETLWNNLSDSVTFYAKWTPAEYCIEYNPNGGIVTSMKSYYTVEDSIDFYVPTKVGYSFEGWYYDEDLTQSAGDGLDIGTTGNKSLYAKWTANTYTVTLDLNDDDKDPATVDVQYAEIVFGESFTLPVASRNGYYFNGWRAANGMLYTLDNGSSVKPWDIAENTTLYADWTRKQYYIRVNANGTISWLGEDGFSSTQVPIAYGTEFMTVTEIEQAFNPQKISYKEGHKFSYFTLDDGTKFISWSEIPDFGEDGTVITINANFVKEINFNIVYYNYPASNINPLTANYGDDITLMIPENRSGYNFKYWVVADVNTSPNNSVYVGTMLAPGSIFNYTSMPDLSIGKEEDGSKIILEAHNEANSYQITLSSEYGSLPYNVKAIVYNQKVTLPILTEQGRTFLGWFTEQTGGVKITGVNGEMINSWGIAFDTTLYAHWTTNEYSVTYVDGYTHSNISKFTIDDLPITLTNPVRSGYRFMGWYSDDSYATRINQLSSIGNKTLYAKWAKIYTVSFSTTNGTSCATRSGIEGETIVLPTSTRGGYKGTWSYWGYLTGNSNTSNFGYSYTIGNSNVTLYVAWKEKSLSECLNNSVYEIWTYNQLNSIRNNYSTSSTSIYGTYKLMSNITASGYWTPVNYAFRGTLDGNNKQISGLKINVNDTTSTSSVYIGMFRRIYGTVKNVSLINASVSVSGNTSFYVGTLAGEILKTTKISNCKVYATSGTVCSVSVTGTSKTVVIGGLIGYIQGGTIEKSRFTGEVYTSTNGSCEAGGLVGRNTSGKINKSWTSGNLNINSTGGTSDFDVGGLVGRNVYNSSTGGRPEIINCYSTSTVFIDCTGKNSYVYAGGLVGVLKDSKVNYCYATGNVTGKNKYGRAIAGGLAADIEDCVSSGFVVNVFSAGDVYARGNYSGAESSSSFFGHFCGAEKNNAFLNIYYNKDAKFKDGKTGKEVTWNTSWYNGKTVAQLKSSSFQINELQLDTTVWNIVNGSYPTLK